MIKRIIRKLLRPIIGLLIISGAMRANAAVQEQPVYTPDNTELYFDIDGVVLSKSWLKTVKIILQHSPCVIYSAFSLKRIQSARQHVKQNGWAGEGWRVWSETECPAINKVIIAIQQSKTPIVGTVALIEKLKSAGFAVHAATNMGTREFDEHQIHKLFKSAKTIDYKQKPSIQKPQPVYFDQLLADHSDATKPYKLFIDDSKANVKTAQDKKFISIHFKNPEQLEQELNALSIVLK